MEQFFVLKMTAAPGVTRRQDKKTLRCRNVVVRDLESSSRQASCGSEFSILRYMKFHLGLRFNILRYDFSGSRKITPRIFTTRIFTPRLLPPGFLPPKDISPQDFYPSRILTPGIFPHRMFTPRIFTPPDISLFWW